MTNHVPSSRTGRPEPTARARIARVAYATIAMATAAVIFLSSFI
jgi:hypothetical protein